MKREKLASGDRDAWRRRVITDPAQRLFVSLLSLHTRLGTLGAEALLCTAAGGRLRDKKVQGQCGETRKVHPQLAPNTLDYGPHAPLRRLILLDVVLATSCSPCVRTGQKVQHNPGWNDHGHAMVPHGTILRVGRQPRTQKRRCLQVAAHNCTANIDLKGVSHRG